MVTIEPHLNGPLFVEIHFLMNTTKKKGEECKGSVYMNKPYGICYYLGFDSHYFGSARYCCFNLLRFERDLHSLIKDCREYQKCVPTLVIHIDNVLEKLHYNGVCHTDVEAQNLMILQHKYLKQQTQANHDKGAANNSNIKMKRDYDNKEEIEDFATAL
uniref:Protein kinase domain-containing protein n=1 Tax=Glossina austeni TaxID=7395 RepID=A0A1A9V089_GLOAU